MNRARLVVAGFLAVSAACAIAFAVNDVLGAQTQLAALTLGGGFGALAIAFVVWEHRLMPHRNDVQDMAPPRSAQDARAAARSAFSDGSAEIVGRQSWLAWVLAGAGGVMAVALAFPLRSLSEKSASELRATSWRPGSRLVRADGTLVRTTDVEIDGVMTVFPEGHVAAGDTNDMANTATVLVHVPPAELQLAPDRAAWAPQGFVAYSKVCTHAGCPVALYRAKERQLFCPCHQSTFDVLRGGMRVFGPAARALPQLPLRIASDGTLEAAADYDEPIGPGYWDRS